MVGGIYPSARCAIGAIKSRVEHGAMAELAYAIDWDLAILARPSSRTLALATTLHAMPFFILPLLVKFFSA